MNTKTAARMKRVSRVFDRIAAQAEREIRRLNRIQHVKPEDFHAGVALREISDLAKAHAARAALPCQRELSAS